MAAPTSAFRPRDAALLGLLALIWGNSFLLIKVAVGVLPPLWVVTGRMVVGGGLLAALAVASRSALPRDARSLGTLALLGVVGGALPWAAQGWAQQFLDSGLVSVLNSCTPVVTLGLAVLVGQERLYRHRVVGLAVAIVGTLIVIRGEVGIGRSVFALLVAALATTGYALGGVLTRARISGRVAHLPAAATQLCFGGLALLPCAWVSSGAPPTALSPLVLGALLALGLVGTGVAFVIYFTLIESVGATNASMVTYLAPIVGLASGALVRGERFGAHVLLGAGTLIFGVWLAQRREPTAARVA